MQLIAELSTNHGGDYDLADDMVRAAWDAGASIIKAQHYIPDKINPTDAQRDWLRAAHLSLTQHASLKTLVERLGMAYMVTPFCADSLAELRSIGVTHFKIASSESSNNWWEPGEKGKERWFVSFPWGLVRPLPLFPRWDVRLTAIPLYPTPLECVSRAPLLDGWSDHGEGLSACEYAIAHGAKVIEVHFCLEDRGRRMPYDKTAADLKRLRAFADDCETITSGVATRYRTRWSA